MFGLGVGVRVGGGQGGCERRIEVFVKIQKKMGGGSGVRSGGGGRVGGQGGCERRIEVFGKIHKKSGGGVGKGGQVRVGLVGGSGMGSQGRCNREVKVL